MKLLSLPRKDGTPLTFVTATLVELAVYPVVVPLKGEAYSPVFRLLNVIKEFPSKRIVSCVST